MMKTTDSPVNHPNNTACGALRTTANLRFWIVFGCLRWPSMPVLKQYEAVTIGHAFFSLENEMTASLFQ
jgi:hypothetical protein